MSDETPERRQTIASHVVWRDDAAELVLFDSSNGRYHTLSRIGSEIWRRWSRGLATGTIIADLAAEYGVSNDMVREQVLEFLATVRAAGLLADGEG
jgi:hypothetical protein